MLTLVLTVLFQFQQPIVISADSTTREDTQRWIEDIVNDLSTSIGSKAPNFQFTTISDSVTHNLSEFDGKTVMLKFWNRGCAPCIKEFPEVSELQDDYEAAGLTLILVANMNVESQKRFWLNYSVSGLKASVNNDNFVKPYKVSLIPMATLIDKSGFIRDGWFGAIGYDQMEAKLNKLIPKTEKSFRIKKRTLFVGLLITGISFIVIAVVWNIKRAKTD